MNLQYFIFLRRSLKLEDLNLKSERENLLKIYFQGKYILMANKYLLKVIQNTTLKVKPVDPGQLADAEKAPLAAPKEYSIHSFVYDRPSNHIKVAFLFDNFKGRNTWYIAVDTVQMFDTGKLLNFKNPLLTPEVKTCKLEVPYFSQLDNINNPTGSCNVTSVAMCLSFLGLRPKNPKVQLEDEFYQYCLDKGLSRHSPLDLAKVVKAYGYKDDFQDKAKWADVKTWLSAGKPIVVHGYFTTFGHIVVIRGFNERGWIVNDPYGEWWDSGYDTNASGAGLTYSYGMMQRICGNDGDLWIHYISK